MDKARLSKIALKLCILLFYIVINTSLISTCMLAANLGSVTIHEIDALDFDCGSKHHLPPSILYMYFQKLPSER